MRRTLAGLTAFMIVSAAVQAITALPAAAAEAADGAFAPIVASSFGDQSAYGRVVGDGRGTFHSVARLDGASQDVVYRRSVDGGRTWTVRALFHGDDGGATRPALAVDGARVAVAFLGRWCEVPEYCNEAPYLAVSTDAGLHWSRPRRLDRRAAEVHVAVDDTRTWVAWDGYDGVDLVGSSDDAATVFASRHVVGMVPRLAAADGMMVLAYHDVASAPGQVSAMVAVEDRLQPPTVIPSGGNVLSLADASTSVAAADGLVHVLMADRAPSTDAPFTRGLWVASADPDGDFEVPVRVMGMEHSAAIAASRGTVAVAMGAFDGTTWLSTRSTGTLFGPPVAVATTSGREPWVALGLATPPSDAPLARFAWSVTPRYVDTDGDGLRDPANDQDGSAADRERIRTNASLAVALDGCRSIAGTGRHLVRWTWYHDDAVLAPAGQPCRSSLLLADGEAASIRLEVEDDRGKITTAAQSITPRDHLVVSLGDSVASGEGNPHTGGLSAASWQDDPCHRSAWSGPALSAGVLEDVDPHSSVTFVQLACSGAAISDQPPVAGVDVAGSGGLLDAYDGVVPAAGSLRPSQLSQMASLVGDRSVDAVELSIGANDVKFADIVVACLSPLSGCDTGETRATFEEQVSQLPGRYRRVATDLAELGIAADRVRLTEYFDPTTDDLGVTNMRCALGVGVITDDEARWARNDVVTRLNAAGRTAASVHEWRYVGGIAAGFDRHGYCASDHWVVQIAESEASQHDKNGSFHPNRSGHLVYGRALARDLLATLGPVASEGTAPAQSSDFGELGDLIVMTESSSTVTAAAVTLTGYDPAPLGVRIVDRNLGTRSQFGFTAPPALDSAAAVGVWTEIADASPLTYQTLAAPLASRPNAAVRDVRIVQAPADGSFVVAGRPTLVQATIDASIGAPTPLDVTFSVVATGRDGVSRQLVAPTTERLTFVAGRQKVLLPRATTFAAAPDEVVSATVQVADPPGARAVDAFDDMGTSGDEHSPTAVRTRPLRVQIGVLSSGAAAVPCVAAQSLAQRSVSFAQQAMPVDAGGIDVSLFCGLTLPAEASEPGVLRMLLGLDEIARYAGLDIVGLVVPDGWLNGAIGAVGATLPGTRGVILEAGASDEVFSHEVAHTLFVEHTESLVPAAGVRVDRRLERGGVDWMAPSVQPKVWTGGHTWDLLATGLGGPEVAPRPIDPAGGAIWVRGTVEQGSDGTWGVTLGDWVPTAPGAPFDPRVGTGPSTSRLLIQQLDAGGAPIGDAQPAPLGSLESFDAPLDATSTTGGAGAAFAARVNLLPTTTSLRLVLDGRSVAEVPLTAPPHVTITAPSAGAVVARGEPLTVAWNASDPDGDPLDADVFVSDDGTSWRALAVGVTGTSITVPVPQDVGGTAVQVRVAVSDGARVAEAVSAPFSAEPEGALGNQRIVFIRDEGASEVLHPRVLTMDPDGTDLVEVPLPNIIERTDGGCAANPPDCDARYYDPTWGDDGRIYFSSNLVSSAFPQDDGASGDWSHQWLYSSKPDGSDLRRITAAHGDTTYWPTGVGGASLGQETNRCPDVSADGRTLAWMSQPTSGGPQRYWVARRDGNEWSTPTLVFDEASPSLSVPASFPTPSAAPTVQVDALSASGFGRAGVLHEQCPRVSPDGSELAIVARVRYPYASGTATAEMNDWTAVISVPSAGGPARIVSPKPTYVQGTGGYANLSRQLDFVMSVDWSSLTTLTVSRGFELPTYNPGSAFDPGPQLVGVFSLDVPTGGYTRLTPLPDLPIVVPTGLLGLVASRPSFIGVSPGGDVYGGLTGPVEPGCSLTRNDLAIVDLSTGEAQRVLAPRSTACQPNDYGYDWGVVPRSGGPGGVPRLTVDPAAAPADPNSPDDGPVSAATEPSPTPAPGADAGPAPFVPRAVPMPDVTVPAGRSTTIVLSTEEGTPSLFEVVDAPPTEQLSVRSSGSSAPPIRTGVGGELVLTPVPGFVGTTTFTYAVVGDSARAATVTVRVIGNEVPVALADELPAVPVGSTRTFDGSVLLDNDRDPDSSDPLRLVAVFGAAGAAWLTADGSVVVSPMTAGVVGFRYLVADAAGAIGEGVGSFVALPPSTTTTTTTTTTSTPTTTTSTTTTSTTTTSTSTSTSTTSAPPAPSTLVLRVRHGLIVPATPRSPAAALFEGTFTTTTSSALRCGDPVTVTIGSRVEALTGWRSSMIGGLCVYLPSMKGGSFTTAAVFDLRRSRFTIVGAGRAPSFDPLLNPVHVGVSIGEAAGAVSLVFVRHGLAWTYPE